MSIPATISKKARKLIGISYEEQGMPYVEQVDSEGNRVNVVEQKIYIKKSFMTIPSSLRLIHTNKLALPDRWNMEGLVLLDPYRSRIRKCSDGKVIRSGENKVLGKIWLVESRHNNGYYVSYSSPSGEKSIEISKGDWYGPIEIYGKCGKNELTGISFLHAREDSIYLSPVS